MSRHFSIFAWLAALAALALSISQLPARSETARPAPPEVEIFTCIETWNTESCVTRAGRPNPHVIAVPAPASESERAAAEARDRRWAARCRPTLQPDAYGMQRYVYAAAGCEYGRAE